jgi:iron complex transport system substrate-binding protein
MIVTDQLHRRIDIKTTPSRIISLVPSLTELIVDLGLESRLVGLTKFCVHPKHIRQAKTVVGGTKQINLDKIRKLQPDIVLSNKEENTPEMIKALTEIAPVHISDIYTVEDCYSLIRMYGDLFEVEQSARALINQIEQKRINYQQRIKDRHKLKVAYFIWKKPWMVAGSHTFIDAMLKEAGFKNVFTHLQRYPEIDLDTPILKTADCLFLSSEPYPFKAQHRRELQKLFPDKLVHVVDGELFSWYGSRMCLAYKYFDHLQLRI